MKRGSKTHAEPPKQTHGSGRLAPTQGQKLWMVFIYVWQKPEKISARTMCQNQAKFELLIPNKFEIAKNLGKPIILTFNGNCQNVK